MISWLLQYKYTAYKKIYTKRRIMKKRNMWVLAVCVAVLCLSLSSCDNDDEKYWSKLYSGGERDYAQYCEKTGDGGFIVTGYRGMGDGSSCLLMKVDAAGTVERDAIVQNCWLKAMCQAPDGGYFFTGSMADGEDGKARIGIVRLDASFSIVWQKSYAMVDRLISPVKMVMAADGGVIVSTSFTSDTRNYAGVMKLDGAGNVRWSKRFDCGIANIDIIDVVCMPDGGFMVGGNSSRYYHDDTYSGFMSVFFMKLDADGIVQWNRAYTARDNEHFAALRSLRLTPDGGLIAGINGYAATGDDTDIWKLDALANVTWNKTFRSVTPLGIAYWGYGDHLSAVVPVSDGGYIAYGSTYYYTITGFSMIDEGPHVSDGYLYLIKLDGDGNSEWQKSYNDRKFTARQRPEDSAGSITETEDGYVASATHYGNNYEGPSLLLMKMDDEGAIPGSGLSIQTDVNIPWGFIPDPKDLVIYGTDIIVSTGETDISLVDTATVVTDL
jgi:hypothetical protein